MHSVALAGVRPFWRYCNSKGKLFGFFRLSATFQAICPFLSPWVSLKSVVVCQCLWNNRGATVFTGRANSAIRLQSRIRGRLKSCQKGFLKYKHPDFITRTFYLCCNFSSHSSAHLSKMMVKARFNRFLYPWAQDEINICWIKMDL